MSAVLRWIVPSELGKRIGARLAREPDVQVAALFGSAVQARLRPESDVDVYVRLAPHARWDLGQQLALGSELSALCGREVDLVVEGPQTSVILRREVAARGEAVYEARPGAWTALRASALVAYADLEPYLSRIGRAVAEKARTGG